MKNWQKDRNYRKYEEKDSEGNVIGGTYFITVDGANIEVSKEIFSVYAATERKMEYMEYDLKRDRVLQNAKGQAVTDENGQPILLPEREVSLDKLLAEDWDYPSTEALPEDEVVGWLEIETLRRCLDLLTNSERELIDALFFGGLTEREYSAQSGIPQKTINDRKHRVLGKLKKLLKN